MTITFRGTHTPDAWAEWVQQNTTVADKRLQLARESVATYASPEAIFAEAGAPETPVAIATDDCEDLVILNSDGDLFRYDPVADRLQRRECVNYTDMQTSPPLGRPVDLCFTGDTYYIVDATMPGVVALSAASYQPRWATQGPLESPVAVSGFAGTAYVLDESQAAIYSVTPTGVAPSPTIDELEAPIDLAIGTDGRLLVLDRADPGDDAATSSHVVRVFRLETTAADDVEPAPTSGDNDHEPERFVHERTVPVPDRYEPTCLVSLGSGGFVLGTAAVTGSRTTPVRYVPTTNRFSPVTSLTGSTTAFARAPLAGHLYTIALLDDSETDTPGVYRLSATSPYRLDSDRGTYTGTAWRRFDAGETETVWHRFTADISRPSPGTAVSVRYLATDDSDLGTIESDFGIPDTYHPQLEQAGITGAWRLVEVGAEDLAAICSVPTERITAWVDRALDFVAEQTDDDIEDIDDIGPIYGERLKAAGLWTVADLFRVDRDHIRRITDAPAGRVDNWYQDAKSNLGETDTIDLELDIGIPRAAVALLAAAGIADIETLLLADPTALADQLQVTPVAAAEWVERGQARIDQAWDDAAPNSLATPDDALLTDAVGRYLWVAVDLLGREDVSPTVRSARAYFPRDSYLRYLPAIYRDDADSAAFLERFLALFESTVMDIGESIETLPALLDAESIPADAVPWLANWLAVNIDEVWPVSVQRELLAAAPALSKQRGTPDGIRQTLCIALGDPPPISEARAAAIERERASLAARDKHQHASSDSPTDDLSRLTRPATVVEAAQVACIEDAHVRALYKSLLGCPQCFLVLLDPDTPAAYHEPAERLVDAVTPAHTVARTVPLRHQFKLTGEGHAGHTYLGLNSTLADPAFVLETASLDHDAALGAAEDWGRLERASRLNRDATLS